MAVETPEGEAMRRFSILLPVGNDIPDIMLAAFGHMGSLVASEDKWYFLFAVMGVYGDNPNLAALAAAAQLIVERDFQQASPHPRCATYTVGDRQVSFLTPGGVTVTLTAADGGCDLSVDFGRDSSRLARAILGDLSGRLPAAARLLAEVRAEDWDIA